MNYTKTRWFPFALLLAVFLWGCDQSPMTTDQPKVPAAKSLSSATSYVVDGEPTAAGRDLNDRLKAMSKAVAKVLAKEEVRMRFFKAAMDRFAGETAVLWMHLAPEMKQAVLSAAQAGHAPGLSSMRELEMTVGQASEALGGPLKVAWTFAENFDGSRAPWVTFTPVQWRAQVDAPVGPDQAVPLTAYDADGQPHKVNEEIARSRPVVAITLSERATASGEVITPNNIQPCEACGGGGGGGTGGGNGDGGGGNEYAGYMRLNYVQFHSDHWDEYPVSDPEFRIEWTKYNAETEVVLAAWHHTILDSYISDDDIDQDPGPEVLNKVLFDWQAEEHPGWHAQWYEYDGEADGAYELPISTEIPLPQWAGGGSLPIDFTLIFETHDDMLGAAMTDEESADPDAYYGTGAPDFEVRLLQ